MDIVSAFGQARHGGGGSVGKNGDSASRRIRGSGAVREGYRRLAEGGVWRPVVVEGL